MGGEHVDERLRLLESAVVHAREADREANRVRLQSENAAYEPIYSSAAQLEGQVVAVVRLLR